MSGESIYANAIPQVDSTLEGIHLLWTGPRPWVYSTEGWYIQRRKAREPSLQLCDGLGWEDIEQMRQQREKRLRFATLRMEEGLWPSDIVTKVPVPSRQASDIFTIELDRVTPKIWLRVQAQASFVVALRNGKVTAVAGPSYEPASYDLNAIAIDTVIVYALPPYTTDHSNPLHFCIYFQAGSEEEEWRNEPVIVKALQIPLQGLVPGINNPDDEYSEAKKRLLPGEKLDENEFKNLANILRLWIQKTGPPRPIDQVLLIRNDPTTEFEELSSLDSIRVLIPHPKWRRVLGFGWFDDDPSLSVGDTYEYRITGFFQIDDLTDRIYSFHTIPSQTALPSEFYLEGLRLRISQPTTVKLSPDTSNLGLAQLSRRGIDLLPQNQSFWQLPSLEDWNLVIDFRSHVRSIILELHEEHDLEYSWGEAWGSFSGPLPVPSGTRPRLDFPTPAQQLRLRGTGFLFAIRIPSDPTGIKPVSVVLPPVEFVDSPRPQPPLTANITNLQISQPAAIDDTPPAVLPAQNSLGFEIKWRPSLLNGLSVWSLPPKTTPGFSLPAPPPLDSTTYMVEHREVTPDPDMPVEMLSALSRLADDGYWPSVSDIHRINGSKNARKKDYETSLSNEKKRRLAKGIATRDIMGLQTLLFTGISEWMPILEDENWILGDRDHMPPDPNIFPGVDLLALFPEVPRHSSWPGLDVSWRDVFDFSGDNIMNRPVPMPGTFHQYRVATVDAIGRPSLTYTETNVLRLEKRIPPPVPVGPDEISAEQLSLPAPIGVQARVLVQNAPDLTSEDLVTLGTDNNAIILQWGWHPNQREQDPLAREFRVYVASKPLDSITGSLTRIVRWTTHTGGGYVVVTLALDRPVAADAAVGSYIHAGYPYYVSNHTAGSEITALLEVSIRDSSGDLPLPTIGPIILPLHLTPTMTRPPAWSERIVVQSLTSERKYEAMIRNRLTVTDNHPFDSIWVGVSAADDQSYVPDQLEPNWTRSGNESAIVPVLCTARYYGRPIFDIPPILDPVPVLITPEPQNRPISFNLDLSPYIADLGLDPGALIRPERVSADAIFAACRVTADGRIMGSVVDRHNSTEVESEIVIPNPTDRNAIIAALGEARTDALEDRFINFLAGSHPYRDRLFESATENPVPLGPFQETLQSKAGRYVYRVRKSDAAGHISVGGAIVKVIIRVPSLAPGGAPERSHLVSGDPPGTIRLRITPGKELTHVLIFSEAGTKASSIHVGAELLRVSNAHHLYPNHGIRLKLSDGSLLSPYVKSLSDVDVTTDAEEFRHVQMTFNAEPGKRIRVWACTLTRDGIPSLLAGPWGLALPIAALPLPTLSVIGVPPDLLFTWTWPQSQFVPAYSVSLERSEGGDIWQRVSAPLPETSTNYSYSQILGMWSYRLRVMSPDGRSAYSNTVTVEALT